MRIFFNGQPHEVEEGTTLLKAAEQAGVYINSLCGGEGLCGECRLQVISGNAKAENHAIGFFSADEIMKGYVLACQTRVEGDLTVLIATKSRLEMERIITEGVSQNPLGAKTQGGTECLYRLPHL